MAEQTLKIQNCDLSKVTKCMLPLIEANQIIPILSCLKITAKQDQVHILASDAEHEIHATIPIADPVKKEKTFCLSAKTLADICRVTEGDKAISFTEQQAWIKVDTSHSTITLANLADQSFPTLSQDDHNQTFQMSASTLKTMITDTEFSLANEGTKRNIHGLSLHIGNRTITCTATDGHRLAMTQAKIEQDINAKCILQRKFVNLLAKNLSEDEIIRVSIGKKQIKVETSNITMISTLIAGHFPPCDGFIPNRPECPFTLKSSTLKDALTRSHVLSYDKIRIIQFTGHDDQLEIASQHENKESTIESLTIQYQGESFVIRLNSDYLYTAIKCLNKPEITIDVAKDLSRIYMHENDLGIEKHYLIMSMTQ
ncbi:DNA polymerase III subunit beta [Gammaproteobacteria bacterium]|nr:DNA polymerase III subunit beta [Gammaproteobacteria bacterium]